MASLAALLALLVAVAAAHDGAFTVLSAPNYFTLDASAGMVNGAEVPSILANILGFETTETRVSWGGVLNQNVFKRPSAILSLLFEDATSLPFATPVASFPLTHAHSATVLSGKSQASLATLVSEIAGTASFNLAVSADSQLTATALPRDVSGSRDIDVHPTASGFGDSLSTLSVSREQITKAFSSGLLGAGVVYNAEARTFTVGATVFDLSQPEVEAFFVELHAALLSLSMALALPQARPSTFTLAVSTLRSLPASQQTAAGVVLAAFANKATALVNAAFNGNVVSVALVTSAHSDAHHRVARAASPVSASYKPSRTGTDYIANCDTYTCYCNRYTLSNGTIVNFDPVTLCVSPCPPNVSCPCTYSGCDCQSGNIQPGAARCSACESGFILQGGQCYVSSNFPGMVQIWLWGGLLIAVALIATCYTIGGMDPGRNGIIYRMTNQRTKNN